MRELIVFITVCVFVMAACEQRAHAAPTDEQCSAAAEISVGALRWRNAGMTEEVAMDFLRKQKVYSGLPVWAVKKAYDAPADVAEWMLSGFVFGECGKRE